MTTPAIAPHILSACRRHLMALIESGQGTSLGTLAAELDLPPPAAVVALHRTVVMDLLPIRAELLVACPCCEETVQLVTGLAAWILTAQEFQVPCTCGETFAMGPSYLDLVLVPSVARHKLSGARKVAESAHPTSASVSMDDRPEQLTMDLGF
jgi:hypothetical protein